MKTNSDYLTELQDKKEEKKRQNYRKLSLNISPQIKL